MTPTRQTFAGLSHWEIVFWYVLIVVSTGIFVWGCARLVLKYRRGRSNERPTYAPNEMRWGAPGANGRASRGRSPGT